MATFVVESKNTSSWTRSKATHATQEDALRAVAELRFYHNPEWATRTEFRILAFENAKTIGRGRVIWRCDRYGNTVVDRTVK